MLLDGIEFRVKKNIKKFVQSDSGEARIHSTRSIFARETKLVRDQHLQVR